MPSDPHKWAQAGLRAQESTTLGHSAVGVRAGEGKAEGQCGGLQSPQNVFLTQSESTKQLLLHCYFAEEKTGTERLSNLLKATQPV